MKIILTDELIHKSNSDYQGVLVQFGDDDKHYFHNRKNWLPKSSEAYALHKLMYALDPKYRGLVDSDTELATSDVLRHIHHLQLAIKELANDLMFVQKHLKIEETQE